MPKVGAKYQHFNRGRIHPNTCMTLSHLPCSNPSPHPNKTLFIRPDSQPQGYDFANLVFVIVADLSWLLGCSSPVSPNLAHQLSSLRLEAILDFLDSSQGQKGSWGRLPPEAASEAVPFSAGSTPCRCKAFWEFHRDAGAQIALGLTGSPSGFHHPLGFWSQRENREPGRQSTFPSAPSNLGLSSPLGLPSFPGSGTSLCGTTTTLESLICDELFSHSCICLAICFTVSPWRLLCAKHLLDSRDTEKTSTTHYRGANDKRDQQSQ